MVPQSHIAQVWIDFDGTITACDVLDELIEQFSVDQSWMRLESEWAAGRIGSFECLTGEFDQVRITGDGLRRFLESIPIDPGAGELLRLLERFSVPYAILSDGVDQFIRNILLRLGITGAIVRSNSVSHVGEHLKLECPHRRGDCDVAAAHCKCASARSLLKTGRKSVYIGDGRSDLCPARKADLVFAKGSLAGHLRDERRPFIPFESLFDVAAVLAARWSCEESDAESIARDRSLT